MNIMLTDIRSLTLEMQDMPVVAQGDADSFPHLLQQQFPEATENPDQIIEFDEYFENMSDPDQTPGSGIVGPAAAAWQDFLAQQQIRITTDIDPVSVNPVETSVAPLDQPLLIVAAGAQIPPGTGEQLPVGGNSLPDESIEGLAVPRGENMPTGPSVDPAIAALNSAPVAAEPQVNRDRPALTPMAVTDTGSNLTGAPANSSGDSVQAVVAETIPARLAGGQVAPVAPASMNAVYAAEIANSNESDARAQMPAFATQVSLTRTDATGERMPNPAALADDKPDGLAQSANPARESVSKDLPLPRDPEAALPISAREARISNSGALPGDVAAGGERTGSNELPETIKTPTQPVKLNPEAVGPELAANRNLELPQQNSTSQSQQAITATSVSGHGHAFNGTVTAPAVIQNTLPAQLESMNLGRAADAGEWGDGLGERVNWMINQKQNSATIRLDPPMLGKLDVQIKIADDATTVTIHTQHAQTRDLIETASVRLRDFLQESGYQNVNVDVSQHQDQQQAHSQTSFDENSGNQEDLQSGQESAEMHGRSAGHFIGDGLLDTFA